MALIEYVGRSVGRWSVVCVCSGTNLNMREMHFLANREKWENQKTAIHAESMQSTDCVCVCVLVALTKRHCPKQQKEKTRSIIKKEKRHSL